MSPLAWIVVWAFGVPVMSFLLAFLPTDHRPEEDSVLPIATMWPIALAAVVVLGAFALFTFVPYTLAERLRDRKKQEK